MKGIVFTEFLEMVEEQYSVEIADEILTSAPAGALATSGAYTAVGTYDPREMSVLVTRLGEVTGTPTSELLLAFGRRLFGRFTSLGSGRFEWPRSAFEFLRRSGPAVHAELKRLVPEADPPRLEAGHDGPNLVLTYRSDGGLGKLAEGLILGCLEHYGEAARLTAEDLSGGAGRAVRFVLTRQEGR